MVKKKQKNIDSKLLFRISKILFALTFVSWFVVILFLAPVFCGVKEDQCGFNGVGIAGYALYVAAVPFLLAVVTFFAGLDRKEK